MLTVLALTAALGAPETIEATSVAAGGQRAKPLGFTSTYRNVAVMPLSSLGSTAEALAAVERILVGEFDKLLGPKMIPPNDLLVKGEDAARAFLECEGVVICLTEVVGGLGWDAFVVGNIAGLGDDRVINLKLIDVRTGGEIRRSFEKAGGEEKELIKQMRKAAVTLLAPELLVGTLDLSCKQPDVQIAVDGRMVGTTPLKTSKVEVPVGRVAVEATGQGRVPFSTFVDVQYNQSIEVNIHLPDSTVFVGGSTPFRERWWTWAIAGAAAVSAGLGAYFNILQADNVSKIEERAGNGTLTVEHLDLFEEEQANWTRAVVFYGVGGGLAAVVAVLFTLDFF